VKKNKISVRLMGRDYALLTDQPPERVQTVARYVDRKMKELQITARVPDAVLPMLTVMTIGDELFSAQLENTRLKKELASLNARMENNNSKETK